MKPIDVLCKQLSGSDDLDIEINEPYMVFKVIICCNLNSDVIIFFNKYALTVSSDYSCV